VGLTLTFAAVGGAVAGPVGGFATGALGSGILQTIASMVDTKPKPSVDIPTEDRSISHYLKALYISATFRWLEPAVQAQILNQMNDSNAEGSDPKARIVVVPETGALEIVNVAGLTKNRLRRLTDALVAGGTASKGTETKGQTTIGRFAREATGEYKSVR
jgi:hypothetical protein